MFKNYLLTAIRSLMRHKLFALINIFGLAVGLAASILILLFVRFEFSYESWLPNAEGIYRVSSIWKNDGKPGAQGEWVSARLRQAMINEFPEMDQVTRRSETRMTLKRGDTVFSEIISRVDPNFFNIFKFDFVKGDGTRVLSNINSIALSEKTAYKYFGDEDPIGQSILANNEEVFEVVAVFKNLPENSELTFESIVLFDIPSLKGPHYFDDWNSQNLQTYFTLKDGATLEKLNSQFDSFILRAYPDDTPETPTTDYYGLIGLAMKDAHLHGTTGGDFLPGGGFKTVITFALVAFLVIAVAVFNFVNSSTAIGQLRAKEVAMRKTLGAGRRQLMYQFLSESALMCFAAFAVALALVELAMPGFREFWEKPISSNYLTDPVLLGGLLVLFPIVVLGAGYYPAVYLTKFRPSETLMSNTSTGGGHGILRKILVLVQFSVSIGLAIVATIIYLQFEYATSKDLGFDLENKIILRGVGTSQVIPQIDTFEQEIERLPGVNSMARSYYVIGDGNNSGRGVDAEWMTEQEQYIRIAPIDFGYFDLLKVPIVRGRDFDRNFAKDVFDPPTESDGDIITPASVIINRAALSSFEIASAEEAIGKTIYINFGYGAGRGEMTIVGVVENFREKNIRENVNGTAYYVQPSQLNNAIISLKPGSLPGVLDDIEDAWKLMYPNVPIRHEFLDEKLERLYSAAQKRSQMLYAFAMLAIIISALGLYGLASFTAVRRTKEIGVRKIMGASSLQITGMMVRQFSMPVILANILAWPVAWYVAQNWLETYNYRIDIDPIIFILFGLGAVALAWVTVGSHAWKASRNNPVNALRDE